MSFLVFWSQPTLPERNMELFSMNALLCSPAAKLVCLDWCWVAENSSLLLLERRLMRVVRINPNDKAAGHKSKIMTRTIWRAGRK